ncbi:M48 family metalloprotease [Pseudosulfitobacter sp. SM2401]|uniref:M48 family metallopeptidase n=1 Tax=Pseudosulfitobacter sp. SM2401 TaxID=3350098 RepID=UPI0036F33CEF
MRRLFERMNGHLAARAFQAAQEDVDAAQSQRRVSLILANVLAVLVLSTPLMVFALAGWLLSVSYDTVLGWILVALLLGLAWVLIPRRPRNDLTTYGRDDLPELFELLDQVCADLDAPQIDGVHLMAEMNAYLFEYRPLFGAKQNIMGIGLGLWYTLAPKERLALMAHEIGHLVNRDPGRSLIIWYAMQTLEAWLYWLRPDDDIGGRGLGEMLTHFALAVFGLLCELIWTLLNWSMMYHAQIAEYVADAKSVSVAGKRSAHTLLFTSVLSPEAERSTRRLRTHDQPHDGWIFDHMAAAVHNTSDETKEHLMSVVEAKKSSIDDSHPPTVYRIAFVDQLPDTPARVTFSQQQADAIDASFVPYKDALGAQLLRRIEVY